MAKAEYDDDFDEPIDYEFPPDEDDDDTFVEHEWEEIPDEDDDDEEDSMLDVPDNWE